MTDTASTRPGLRFKDGKAIFSRNPLPKRSPEAEIRQEAVNINRADEKAADERAAQAPPDVSKSVAELRQYAERMAAKVLKFDEQTSAEQVDALLYEIAARSEGFRPRRIC